MGSSKWGWLAPYPHAGKSAFFSFDHNGNVLVMTASGNVGIGTDSPGDLLDVSAANSVTAGGHEDCVFRNAAGTAGLTMGWYADGTAVTGGWMRSISGLPFFIGTAGAPQALTVLNSGNVGVGTTA